MIRIKYYEVFLQTNNASMNLKWQNIDYFAMQYVFQFYLYDFSGKDFLFLHLYIFVDRTKTVYVKLFVIDQYILQSRTKNWKVTNFFVLLQKLNNQ